MAYAYATLNELVQINDENLADFEVSNVLTSAPVFAKMAAIEASNGTVHKYLRQTVASSVGFRGVGDGLAKTNSSDEAVTCTLKILDGSFSVDKALADGYTKGLEAYLALEAKRALKQAFSVAEFQIIKGTGNSADGFSGMADLANVDMTINAGGDDDNTSTIYVLRTDEDGCAVVMGNGAKIEIGDFYQTTIAGDTGTYDGYRVPILAWAGFQAGGKYDLAKITNVDASEDIDALLGQAVALFEQGEPNLIVMSKTVRETLRQGYTNQGSYVRMLDEWNGIPIVTSRACGAVDVDEIAST